MKLIHKNNNTMRQQLKQFSYLLIICFVAVWIMLLAGLIQQNTDFEKLWEQQWDINQYYEQLLQTQDTLRNIILFSSEHNYQPKFERESQHLQNLADKITQEFDSRVFFDLNRQTQTYLLHACRAANLHKNNPLACQEAYDEAAYLKDILMDEYDTVYHEADDFATREMTRNKKKTANMITITVIMAGCVLGGSVIYVRKFSDRLTCPITQLSHHAENIGAGQLTVIGQLPEASEELQALANCFDHMVIRLKVQMEELKDMGEVEYRVLQAQINPHFLFNTLNMIQQMIFIEKTEQAMEAVDRLSRLLRYGLANNKAATLKQEIENVDNYMAIQNMRYGNHIVFQKHIDAHIGYLSVPVMVLQPLVENAVIHGRTAGSKKFIIGLDIQVQNNVLHICIYDNGKGMNAKKLEQVRQQMLCSEDDLPKEQKASIGLRNIYRRLNIYFHNMASIQLRSQLYTYTEIRIEIPLEEYDEYNHDD